MKKSPTRFLASLMLASFLLGQSGCNGNDSNGHDSSVSVPVFHPGNTAVPVTGPNVSGTEPFDQAVSALLKRWNIPGAALAITKNGQLVLGRGYGYADFEVKQLMQPDSMSRMVDSFQLGMVLAIRLLGANKNV